MTNFLIKRLLLCVLIIVLVSMVIYAIMNSLPTSFIEAKARELSALPGGKSYSECLADLQKVYGIDPDHPIDGYFRWFSNAITGNFGDSWVYNKPVVEKFADVIWYSFILNIVTLILELVIAIPLGILAAKKQYRPTDYVVTVIALVGISLPGFFFAMVLKTVFSQILGWFPLNGAVDKLHDQWPVWKQILDYIWHFVLPVVTLTITSIGFLMRYTRTNMLEVLNSDYIRTARAKGLSEKVVINKHAFRNTLIPIVTIVGGMLPSLFGGAMITEQLFSIPGIGYISYNAMIKGDIPFAMFYMMLTAVLTVLGTLVADILYAVVDPRVRVN